MKLVIVSVHDMKSRSFGTPVCADSLEMAKRNFRMMIHDDKNKMMHEYPEDFELLHLADYDEFNGKVAALQQPVVLLSGAECVTPL